MKQSIIYILLGFFIATTIAAGTMAVTTVKPAVPRKTIIKEFNTSEAAVDYANTSAKNGWIIKTITILDNGVGRYTPIVILETY